MTDDDYDAGKNGLGCYDLAIACARQELLAGRRLTPAEALERVDAAKDATASDGDYGST